MIDDDKNTLEGQGGGRQRRFNIGWTIVGLFLYIAAVEGGQTIIIKSVFEPHPELSNMLDDLESGKLEPLPDEEKQRIRGMLFTNPVFMGVILSVVFAVPLIIGVFLGALTKGILEAAVALGVGAIYIVIADAGIVEILLVALPLDVGLGAGGAWIGRKIFPEKVPG